MALDPGLLTRGSLQRGLPPVRRFGPAPVATSRFIEQFESFLRAEEDSTARLMLFYQQARMEIAEYLSVLTRQAPQVDVGHYRALATEVERIVGELDAGAAAWVDDSTGSAFAAGKLLSGSPDFTTIHDEAVKALASSNLSLIRETSDGIRRSIQQEVSQALIGSISGPELVARIMGTGLAPGRWRSVEERAGVIARTETMRAFNAGNMAGITESGALLVRWITAKDEAVCPRCGPRSGEVYQLPGRATGLVTLAGQLDAADRAWLLSRPTLDSIGGAPPAHPRCRCTIAAHFRGPGGGVLGDPGDAPEVPLEADEKAGEAISGAMPGMDFDTQLPRLVSGAWREGVTPLDLARAQQGQGTLPPGFLRSLQFWRRHRALTPAEIKRIADLPISATEEFMQARYGLQLQRYGGALSRRVGGRKLSQNVSPSYKLFAKNADLRREVIEAFEAYHRVGAGRYVNALSDQMAGSRYLTTLAPSAERGSTLASMGTDGWMVIDTKKLLGYLADGSLRGGANVNGVREVVVHEIAHSVHNRLGWAGIYVRGENSIDEANALIEAWRVIRSRTSKYLAGWKETGKGGPGGDAATRALLTSRHEMLTKRISRVDRILLDEDFARTIYDEEVAMLKSYAHTGYTPKIDDFVTWRARQAEGVELDVGMLQDVKKKLAALDEEAANTSIESIGEHLPTEYAGRGGPKEDFAESVTLYLLNPDRLRVYSPARYAYIREHVFGGQGG